MVAIPLPGGPVGPWHHVGFIAHGTDGDGKPHEAPVPRQRLERGEKNSAGFFSRKTSWNQQKWRIFMDFPGDKNCNDEKLNCSLIFPIIIPTKTLLVGKTESDPSSS